VDLSLATLLNTQYDVCILSKGTIYCVSDIIILTYETPIFTRLAGNFDPLIVTIAVTALLTEIMKITDNCIADRSIHGKHSFPLNN